MPKIKTHKTTAKRFKYSGSGKLMRTHGGALGGKTHLRRQRAKRAKRLFSKMTAVTTPGEIKRVKRLMPYGAD